MKFGLVNIYSFRPHTQHLAYLSKLLSMGGHELSYLTCDGVFEDCYARSIKGTSKISECSKCILGGVRSLPKYSKHNISSIKKVSSQLDDERLYEIAKSSVHTILRTEILSEENEEAFIDKLDSLKASIAYTYEASLKWIERRNLECVIIFNGRMDMTRAVIEACEKKGIPYVTHERTWYGDGIQLIPNGNCLSLKAFNDLTHVYKDKPLTLQQSKLAAKSIAERYVGKNHTEWRTYNVNPIATDWPIDNSNSKVLILPSSANEILTHPDWQVGWKDNMEALDNLFSHLNLSFNNTVLRCHPNWGEKIGIADAKSALNHYQKWAKKNGVHLIGSKDKSNTNHLIQLADIVIVNGSSAAIEAAVAGKKIFCLGAAHYEEWGIAEVIKSKKHLSTLDRRVSHNPREIQTQALRFVYFMLRRFPQYTKFVKAKTTTDFDFFSGGNCQRIIDMIQNGTLVADDEEYAIDDKAESEIIDLLQKQQWHSLVSIETRAEEAMNFTKIIMKRRRGLNWIDSFRKRQKLGDRLRE